MFCSKEAVNEIDDTKHCKIARFKDKKALDENATISKRKHRAIIYPYKEKNDALVIFHNWEGKIGKNIKVYRKRRVPKNLIINLI